MANNKKSLKDTSAEFRQQLLGKNIYDDSNIYTSAHTRARSDEETPEHGKGTGKYMDFRNGGSMIDINGHPSIPKSGRKGNISQNCYGPENPHKKQD